MMELQARLYNQVHPRFFSVIPTNVFGPHDNFHLEDSHVIPGLIHRALLAKRNGTNFKIRGSGSAVRQFIYSEDLARNILSVLLDVKDIAQMPNGIIVAPHEEVSIREIVEIIAAKMNLSGNQIEYVSIFILTFLKTYF